jgi:two-component system, cell cycle sensor histidine kinase and response regulator CckA
MKEKHKKEGRLLDTLTAIRRQIDSFERSTTYRKLAELILIESEERYRTLFEAANDAILLIQGDQIIDCNPKTLEIFGCTKAQVMKEYPKKFSPEFQPDGQPSHDKAKEKMRLVLEGTPQFFEWRHRRYNVLPFDAEVSLNRVELSGKIFLQAIVRDVTKRKKAEEELQEERQKLQTLLEQAPFGMVLIDSNGEYKYMNPRFRELFGYNLNDTPNGRAWLTKAYPDVAYRRNVIALWKEEIKKKGRQKKIPKTFTVTSKDKTEKTVNFKVVQLEKGGYLVTCEDITDLKRLEDELLKAQKLESIGILAGGIAHDFNNILAVVMGNISLARSHINNERTAGDRLLEAEKACLRAKDLTQQLLTFSRGGEPVKKAIELKIILREGANIAIASSKIECHFFIEDHLSTIAGDEREIRQVFGNILSNAREAMPSGGTLTISAENVKANPKDELPLLERNYVCISIEDTGLGIPKNHLQRIFDPYYTTKPLGIQKGMGLGLAICYSIIKKHDGFIDVESSVEAGTKVSIFLPAAGNDGGSLLP